MLILALTMAGAAPAAAVPVEVFPGFHATICHSGSGEGPASPTAPAHDCCGACALHAPAVLPAAPRPTTIAGVWRVAERGTAAAPAPTLSRQRSPQQARGPPRG